METGVRELPPLWCSSPGIHVKRLESSRNNIQAADSWINSKNNQQQLITFSLTFEGTRMLPERP